MLIDSHCHIHDQDYPLDQDQVLQSAKDNQVDQLIVVGTDRNSSVQAIEFANKHQNVFCAVGVHPHEAKHGIEFLSQIDFSNPKIVAVGEIGLDYHYNFSSPAIQQQVLKSQLEIAQKQNLPAIFHIREAFDDFWPLFDQVAGNGINGVVHSFSDDSNNLEQALKRDLYIGVNGIATFTKDPQQLEAYRHVPLDKLLLETDAPYLAPVNHRGKTNQPAYIKDIAEYLAQFYQVEFEQLAKITTTNCSKLFGIM